MLNTLQIATQCVPEPAGCVAGALLLLPFGANALRSLRQARGIVAEPIFAVFRPFPPVRPVLTTGLIFRRSLTGGGFATRCFRARIVPTASLAGMLTGPGSGGSLFPWQR